MSNDYELLRVFGRGFKSDSATPCNTSLRFINLVWDVVSILTASVKNYARVLSEEEFEGLLSRIHMSTD
jgi:hypothetical protein